MRVLTHGLYWLSALVLVGCTPAWDRQASHQRELFHERGQVVHAIEQSAPGEGEAVEPLAVPAAVVTVDDLVALGLVRHPALQAQYARIARFAHRANRVGHMPAPRVGLTPIGEMAQTASGEVEVIATVSQQFPKPGVLAAQVSEVTAQGQAAEAQLQALRVRIGATIRRQWWQQQLAVQTSALIQDQLSVLKQLRETLIRRSQVPGGPDQSDVLRLDVSIAELNTQLATWDRMVATAQARLRAALSLEADSALPVVANSAPLEALPTEAALQAAAEQWHSDLLKNDSEHQQAAALAATARADRRPAFGVQASYAWVDDQNARGPTSGDDQWALGFSLEVPLWFGAYSAGDREAESALRAAQWERRAVLENIRADIQAALATADSLAAQVELYQADVLAQAQAAYRAEIFTYSSGASTMTDVLQAWRQALVIEQTCIRLSYDHAVALIDVMAAAGLTGWQDLSFTESLAPHAELNHD